MSTVKATIDGFVGFNGVPILLHDGDDYDSEHPLVQAHPEMFTEPRRSPAKPTVTKSRASDG